MIQAFICLGSNIDEPEKQLALAREAIDCMPDLCIAGASAIYLTEPQGLRDQPWFANQVLVVNCADTMTAEGLLELLLAQEDKQGRRRSADAALRYGPRVIDLDLLLFGEKKVRSQRLELPHPRLRQRAFVLVPLAELAPHLCLPGEPSISVGEALAALACRVDGTCIFQ